MTQTSRKRLEWLSWTVALAVGAGGMYAAHQKAKSDAARDVELATADAALARSEQLRVKAEIEARNTQDETVNALRQSADHGFVKLDREGRVVEWNTAMETWTGYTLAEMHGKTLQPVMEAAEYEKHQAAYAPWIQSDESNIKTLIIKCRLVGKDGKKKTVRVTARRIPDSDYAVALLDRPRNVVDLTNGGEAP